MFEHLDCRLHGVIENAAHFTLVRFSDLVTGGRESPFSELARVGIDCYPLVRWTWKQ